MVQAPTLREIRRWDTGELTAAAAQWASTAAMWESTFTELTHQIDTPWRGVAAQRAGQRVARDRVNAIADADLLRATARFARSGADRIESARTAILDAVAAARAAGFTVGEDLTVTSDDPGRRVAGRSLTGTLRSQRDRLMFIDRQVATELTSAAAELGNKFSTGHGLRSSPPDAPPASDIPLPEDPRQFSDVWSGLTTEQKERLFEADDSIGNHDGMPFSERDALNRRHLGRLHAEATAEVDELQSRFDDLAARLYMGDHGSETTGEMHDLAEQLVGGRHRLDGYQAIREALEGPDGVPRLLGLLDEYGHAAVSLGDPDSATRTAVFVPGTGQDITTVADNGRRAMDILNAALAADPNLPKSDVAVTTWLGYDRPMTLTEAAWPDRARNGAAALDRYLDGMQASHTAPTAVTTVIGHSYGSTLVGGAATGGHHLAADNVIAIGSPGMLSGSARDLVLNPGGRVYAMTAGNDPISLVTSLTLGADPHDPDFGATRLVTNPGPALPYSAGLLPGIPAHSSYWDEGNPGLANMGAIVAGLPPAAVLR